MVDKYKLDGDPGLPSEILKLLRILNAADFFEDGLLVGSWAILFYQEVLGIKYVLRTGDIDFAFIPEVLKEAKAFDLEAEFKAIGMEPITDRGASRGSVRFGLFVRNYAGVQNWQKDSCAG